MAQTILVTGSTGSVGSNVCRLAAWPGRKVRALVRPGTDPAPLTAWGIEPVIGDVTEGFDRVEVECDGSPARRQAQIHQRSCLPLAPSSGRQPQSGQNRIDFPVDDVTVR